MAKNSGVSLFALAICAVAVLGQLSAAAQQKAASGQGSDAKDELAQNFLAEHEIARRFHIDPADLPPPKTGAIVRLYASHLNLGEGAQPSRPMLLGAIQPYVVYVPRSYRAGQAAPWYQPAGRRRFHPAGTPSADAQPRRPLLPCPVRPDIPTR